MAKEIKHWCDWCGADITSPQIDSSFSNRDICNWCFALEPIHPKKLMDTLKQYGVNAKITFERDK